MIIMHWFCSIEQYGFGIYFKLSNDLESVIINACSVIYNNWEYSDFEHIYDLKNKPDNEEFLLPIFDYFFEIVDDDHYIKFLKKQLNTINIHNIINDNLDELMAQYIGKIL